MNNEEKILAMLEKLNGTVEKHGEMLEKLNGNVEKHGEMFEKLNDRVDQIQDTQEQMQTTLTRVAVTQENIVIPQIKLLAEGHDTLLHTLARKDRVEALEDDVAMLKTVIKAMSQRIEELEKAQ